jgi:exopolysaccharide biosynthesis polyprenyl glycosylphosphotransferase
MVRRHVTALRLALMAADGLSAVVLFAGISLWRFDTRWPSVWHDAGVDPFLALLTYATAWLTVLWLFGLYRLRARWSVRTELIDVLRAALLLAFATFSALFVLKLPQVSRLFLLMLFGAQIVLTITSRIAIRMLLNNLRNRGLATRYVLIVGTGKSARDFARRVERNPHLGLRIIGHLSVAKGADQVDGRPVLGRIDDIEQILQGHVIDEVAICLPAESVGLVEPVTRLCEEVGRVVRISLAEYSLTLPGARQEQFDGMELLSLAYGPDRAIALAAKRALDIVGGGLALIVLTPVFGLLALWILAIDGRPVLFRQTRVGLHGRPFRVVKFRTMVPDAEERLAELEDLNEIKGHAFKVTEDPRLSRTGRVLRATSLDELPQVWNVLLGQMSLVGPRPPLPREVAGYDLWHRRRLSMKPGITGLWQVQARREEDFDRWVELDLAYIDRWSMWLDIKIMLRTIPAMLQGR